jgi:hypothetical protein
MKTKDLKKKTSEEQKKLIVSLDAFKLPPNNSKYPIHCKKKEGGEKYQFGQGSNETRSTKE